MTSQVRLGLVIRQKMVLHAGFTNLTGASMGGTGCRVLYLVPVTNEAAPRRASAPRVCHQGDAKLAVELFKAMQEPRWTKIRVAIKK